MKMRVLGLVILGFLLCLTRVGVFAALQEKEVLEKVEVTNVGVTVRVFHKKKPVKGLNKADFRLEVNGKVTPIRYIQEQVQTLSPNKNQGLAPGSGNDQRLFVLLFNINDYRIDMDKALDVLFNRVLHSGDRYLLISNSFTLNDRLIQEPLKEKEKIRQILAVEDAKARARISQMQVSLRTIYWDYKSLVSEKGAADLARENFITDYMAFIQSWKTRFMRLDEAQYLQLAKYLKMQKGEKHVVNFFQMSYIPKVKAFSALDAHLSGSLHYLDLLEAMSIPDEIAEKDLANLFLDTGAAFYTILMGSANRKILNDNFRYSPLTLSSESLLKRVTKVTGGAMIRSNNLERFFRRVFSTEDVFYTLFYKPEKTAGRGKRTIKITLPEHPFKIVYNDGSGGAHFQWLVRRQRQATPQISVDHVTAETGILHFRVNHFKVQAAQAESQGKIGVRITAFDEKKARFVADRRLDIMASQSQLDVRVALSQLAPGDYKIFVEVTDRLTGKNDLAMTRMHVAATMKNNGY